MTLAFNQSLLQISESATVALADRVRRLRACGRQLVALQTGDPDFATPQPIIDAALHAMEQGLTHYCDSRGLPELRQAVAEKLRRVNGVEYDPQTEILVSCGGVHAYYCALQAILNPGDEVLVPDPAWMTHANMVAIVKGRPVRVAALPENGFWPTLNEWSRALSPSTRALVINSPCNPTGFVATAEYLAELSIFAEAHDLYVLSDEVYENILFDGRCHVCFAGLPGARARTILVNSLSKTYAMTGWRVGYLAAQREVISEALKASQHSVTNLAPFIQKAAAFALTEPDMQAAARQMSETYACRRERVLQVSGRWGSSPIRFHAPQGAFYFFIDARDMKFPALTIAEDLLEQCSIAVVPGSAYGKCGEGFLRMTIAASEPEIEAGVLGLLEWAARQKG
jgi:aspartate aminotransferase